MRDIFVIWKNQIGRYVAYSQSEDYESYGLGGITSPTEALVANKLEHDTFANMRAFTYDALKTSRRRFIVRTPTEKIARHLEDKTTKAFDDVAKSMSDQILLTHLDLGEVRSRIGARVTKAAQHAAEEIVRLTNDRVSAEYLRNRIILLKGNQENKGLGTRPDFVVATEFGGDYTLFVEEVRCGARRELTEYEKHEFAVDALCLSKMHKGIARRLHLPKNYDVSSAIRVVWTGGGQTVFRNAPAYFEEVQKIANELALKYR